MKNTWERTKDWSGRRGGGRLIQEREGEIRF
jgi:hypothetical protein